MIGINTASVIAPVANKHPMRNGTVKMLPEKACSKMTFAKKPNGTIATPDFTPNPIPTGLSLIDIGPEALPKRLASSSVDELRPHASSIHASAGCVPVLVVGGLSTKEKVRRVYAAWIVASMTDDGVNRNLAIGNHPRQSVRSNGSRRIRKLKRSVAIPISSGSPKPALTVGLFVNLSPESGQDFRFGKHCEIMNN